MTESGQHISCQPGCHTLVPTELLAEQLCVLHFLLSVEHTCSGMRRETVFGACGVGRRSEIGTYVKGTAEKLSRVAVISPPLADEMKKRVLTTFLTLMNLQESLDRSATRNAPGPVSARPSPACGLKTPAVAHG